MEMALHVEVERAGRWGRTTFQLTWREFSRWPSHSLERTWCRKLSNSDLAKLPGERRLKFGQHAQRILDCRVQAQHFA